MQYRVPINSFEAILIAYGLGILTALSFALHAKWIRRTTSTSAQ